MHTKFVKAKPHSFLLRYGIALLSVAIAGLLTLLLHLSIEPSIFPLFLAAVMISAWYGGLGPGLLATGLAILATSLFFSPPLGLSNISSYNIERIGLFVLVSLLISWLNTARQRTEEALRASEQHYRLLFEQNLAGVFLSTLDGRILDCNEAFARSFGYASREEALTRHGSDFYYDTAYRETFINLLQKEGTVTTFEGCGRTKDGRPVWFIENVNLLEDDYGARKLIQGTMIDITERKQAEQSLHESEASYRLLFESNPLPMWVCDIETLAFLAVNDAAIHHYGYSREEFLAMTIKDIRPREDIAVLLEQFSRMPAGLAMAGTWRHLKKDGTIIDVEITVHSLDFAGRPARLVLANDVTERKREEDEIRKQKEILQQIFDHIPVMVNFIDEDGRLKLVNREWTRALGWSLEEIEKQNLDVYAEFYPDSQDRQRVRDFIATSNGEWADFKPRTRDGRVIDTAWAIVHLSDRTIIGIGQDITVRKRVEETLQTFSQRLIEAQEAERRRVARALHDEIGQALTAIKINLQAVQHSIDGSLLAPPLNESSSIIDHALQQVRDLSFDLRPSLLDDLGLVAALRWYVDREAQRAGLISEFIANLLEMRLPPELETACFRIAQEALTNVVRHAQARQVWVELGQHGAELQLIIRDDGIGFDVRATRRRRTSEVNLGLQGMQERALILNGNIEINSAPGRGTEIHAWFPMLSSHPPEDSNSR